jgi:branched-subunit amino acid aminotransferase/4-amino-4-deoxychorismate lyase
MRIVLYEQGGKVHEVLQTRERERDPAKYADGFRLMTVRREPTEGLASGRKTLDFRSNLDALASARANGFDEALFFNAADEAWECSVSNIFAVTNGIVVTPPATRGVLPGIIRDRLLRTATGQTIREAVLPMGTLLGADEVFVTNSLLGIMPVSAIDNQAFRLREGSITAALRLKLETWEREDAS